MPSYGSPCFTRENVPNPNSSYRRTGRNITRSGSLKLMPNGWCSELVIHFVNSRVNRLLKVSLLFSVGVGSRSRAQHLALDVSSRQIKSTFVNPLRIRIDIKVLVLRIYIPNLESLSKVRPACERKSDRLAGMRYPLSSSGYECRDHLQAS
jgi:hypothetical protein